MPTRHQVGPFVDVGPGASCPSRPACRRAVGGRCRQIIGLIGSDGHRRRVYQWNMDERLSDEEVRQSFTRQVALFSGDDSPFAGRSTASTAGSSRSPRTWWSSTSPVGRPMSPSRSHPHVRQVVGIDLTPDLLRLGADRLREAGVPNVLLQEGNASDLPFLDGTFDLVLCRSALHHFRDPAGTVREMARVCRPGGRVVVSDLVPPYAAVKDAYRRSPSPAGPFPHGRPPQ